MNIIIPMAGRGSRLRPHTLTTPKPLISFAGKTIVERLVQDIVKVCDETIDEIAFIIGDFGEDVEKDLINIDNTPLSNLQNLAKAKKVDISDLVVCILDRPRHEELIHKTREAGARIMLISDGDVAGIIATASKETGVDMYVGRGGAPEGVLAASALRCIGGQMWGRLTFRNDDERGRATRLGISDFNKIYTMNELAHGEVMFAATGVTDGSMLRGVRRWNSGASTQSIIMRSKTGTVRTISAEHNFSKKSLVED